MTFKMLACPRQVGLATSDWRERNTFPDGGKLCRICSSGFRLRSQNHPNLPLEILETSPVFLRKVGWGRQVVFRRVWEYNSLPRRLLRSSPEDAQKVHRGFHGRRFDTIR